jgi:predicted TIM-barrel fold metal-dependent hydrolase
MVPLTDVDGSLQEIAYALDTLKADGIGLMTSYGDKWLGDPSFLPIMEELDRRKAVVYTHPTAANCCVNLVRTQQPVMIEFGTDTTRTIADIIFSGNAQKFRDIRWIFSHAGGTMPFLIERFVRNPLLDPNAKATVPDGTLAELKRFYYDTAQTSNKGSMLALSAIIPVSQIVFGTDFPYRTSIDHVKGLRDGGVFTDAQLIDIERGNALRLLPRLAVWQKPVAGATSFHIQLCVQQPAGATSHRFHSAASRALPTGRAGIGVGVTEFFGRRSEQGRTENCQNCLSHLKSPLFRRLVFQTDEHRYEQPRADRLC